MERRINLIQSAGTEESQDALEALQAEPSIDALVALIEDEDLRQLESRLDEFNIFEAIGAVRQEERHSHFLAFLLDPMETHRLGDFFLKGFLRLAVRGAGGRLAGFNSVHVDVMDFSNAEVYRERLDIDILALDRLNKFALIVENKIDSGLHSDQLSRYFQAVEEHFAGFAALGVFLTPHGQDSDDPRFAPLSYVEVAGLVDLLREQHRATIESGVEILMGHYSRMLRRHIVGKQDIGDLCVKIYQKHRRALDEIYRYRLDRVASIANQLKSLILGNPDLVLDDGDRGYIRFAPVSWDARAWRDSDKSWTSSGRILLYEFANWPQGLKLKLIIGPGPVATRQRLLELASAHPPLKPATKTLNSKWNGVFARDFLPTRLLEQGTDDEVRNQIEKQWKLFLGGDFRRIEEIVLSLEAS